MEFELYFIDPTTITSAWHDTAPQILPEHIMSFSMTKNVFNGKPLNGCVASSTMSLTVDNSGGEYTQYFQDPSYWVFVANPDRGNGVQDFITSFHLDRAQMNQNKMVSVNGYDAIDLLDKYTVSGADIIPIFDGDSSQRKYRTVLNLMDFTGLGFKLSSETVQALDETAYWVRPSASFPTDDITYRQLIYWIAELKGLVLEVSGEYETNYGTIFKFDKPTKSTLSGRPRYPNGLPNSVNYVFYYDNEDDPDRPVSYSTQTRDFDVSKFAGQRIYKYNSDEYVEAPFVGGGNVWIEIANNPFEPDSDYAALATSLSWTYFLRHNTSAVKEAFCVGGYWYEANSPTPIPLRDRWHAMYMGFLNHRPHEQEADGFVPVQSYPAYGDVIPTPISSYTYVCNGMETVTCDIESDTETQLIPQTTPTDTAIQELQKNVQIVDSGTDNGWEYRKYSNGTYDAYKRLDLSAVACSTTWGSMYVTAAQTFGTRPSFDAQGMQIFVTYLSSDGHSGWVTNWGGVSGTGTGTWVIIRPTSSTSLSGYLSAHIHSNWT